MFVEILLNRRYKVRVSFRISEALLLPKCVNYVLRESVNDFPKFYSIAKVCYVSYSNISTVDDNNKHYKIQLWSRQLIRIMKFSL